MLQKRKTTGMDLKLQLHRKPVVPLGLMNKGTKEPTEKVLLCRKSATPAVASFENTKLNYIEKNGNGGESRGAEQSKRLSIRKKLAGD